MSKLLEKMRDPTRSGVYRASRDDEIVDASRDTEVRIARIALSTTERVLHDLAMALGLAPQPADSMESLQARLAELDGRTRVLVVENGDRHVTLLRDHLWSIARQRERRRAPFFAVFIDPARQLPLPDLFRGA